MSESDLEPQEKIDTGIDPYAPMTIQTDTNEVEETPLMKNPSFLGMASTQFLGAFNDNLYKQLVLLLAVPVVIAAQQGAVADEKASDIQGWATLVFSLPFVLFSGYAGFISDKHSKRNIIVLAKIAEILIMLLSAAAFYFYDQFGMLGTWTVLFFMGTHSTFFGPGKYGILPELLPKKQLANANGVILMSTFLAIILGTLAAGAVFDLFATEVKNNFAVATPLWKGSVVCIGVAVVGTLTSLMVRRTAPAQPDAKLSVDSFLVDKQVAATLWSDRSLLTALLVSCAFWLVSGICVPVINRVGQLLNASKFETSILVAAIALGIMVGSIVAITLQTLKITNSRRQVFIGLWGMTIMLAIASLWKDHMPMLGYWPIFCALLVLGIFVATYAIPLQVFLQSRPPDNLKGRMIATMNQANFIGILLSGPLYQLFQGLAAALGLPINSVFGMMALLLLPLAIFYRLNENTQSSEKEYATAA